MQQKQYVILTVARSRYTPLNRLTWDKLSCFLLPAYAASSAPRRFCNFRDNSPWPWGVASTSATCCICTSRELQCKEQANGERTDFWPPKKNHKEVIPRQQNQKLFSSASSLSASARPRCLPLLDVRATVHTAHTVCPCALEPAEFCERPSSACCLHTLPCSPSTLAGS